MGRTTETVDAFSNQLKPRWVVHEDSSPTQVGPWKSFKQTAAPPAKLLEAYQLPSCTLGHDEAIGQFRKWTLATMPTRLQWASPSFFSVRAGGSDVHVWGGPIDIVGFLRDSILQPDARAFSSALRQVSAATDSSRKTIERLFEIRNPDALRLINADPLLADVLVEAAQEIRKRFGSAPAILDILREHENPSAEEILLLIPTSLSVKEAMTRLHGLEDDWWFAQPESVSQKLVINFEYI